MLLVGQVQQEHRDLYSQPWQRVYTTNYDDVPLISTKRSALTLSPVTLNSTVKGIGQIQIIAYILMAISAG